MHVGAAASSGQVQLCRAAAAIILLTESHLRSRGEEGIEDDDEKFTELIEHAWQGDLVYVCVDVETAPDLYFAILAKDADTSPMQHSMNACTLYRMCMHN
jgi:hypothetical protein